MKYYVQCSGNTVPITLSGAVARRPFSARHVWRGRVTAIAREAETDVLVSLSTEAGYILSRITPEALDDLRLEEGATAWAVVKAHAL